MIDLMMSAGQDVTDFLERMTGGPLDEAECGDDLADASFFAMAGSVQASVETSHLSAR